MVVDGNFAGIKFKGSPPIKSGTQRNKGSTLAQLGNPVDPNAKDSKNIKALSVFCALSLILTGLVVTWSARRPERDFPTYKNEHNT